jgi:hypothetical protein
VVLDPNSVTVVRDHVLVARIFHGTTIGTFPGESRVDGAGCRRLIIRVLFVKSRSQVVLYTLLFNILA